MSGVLRRPPASASTGSLPVRNELGHVGDGLREYRDHTDAGVSAGVGSGPAVRHIRNRRSRRCDRAETPRCLVTGCPRYLGTGLPRSPKLSGAAAPSRATGATIAFPESDRPRWARAGDAYGDQGITRAGDPGRVQCHAGARPGSARSDDRNVRKGVANSAAGRQPHCRSTRRLATQPLPWSAPPKTVVCADGPSRQGQAPAAGVLVQRAAR